MREPGGREVEAGRVPWECSGRGVLARYVDDLLDELLTMQVLNILKVNTLIVNQDGSPFHCPDAVLFCSTPSCNLRPRNSRSMLQHVPSFGAATPPCWRCLSQRTNTIFQNFCQQKTSLLHTVERLEFPPSLSRSIVSKHPQCSSPAQIHFPR